MAGPLLANLDVRRVSFPVLEELSERTGETAVLTIWDGTESVSVEQIPSRHLVKHTSPMGQPVQHRAEFHRAGLHGP